MHNELFNETSIHTYYSESIGKWSFLSRDLYPDRFLEDMFNAYKNIDGKIHDTKAVGFKSFPEHYMDYGHVNPELGDTFKALMADHTVRKVILIRNNVFAVYVSMVRSRRTGLYLTKTYDDVKVKVDINELQHFIDRYTDAYDDYNNLLKDQQPFRLTYEDLLSTQYPDIMTRLLGFLRVDPTVPNPLPETIPQSSGNLRDAVTNYDEMEYAFRYTPYAKYLDPPLLTCTDALSNDCIATNVNSFLDSPIIIHKWALLIPICSRNQTTDYCRELLVGLRDSLLATLSSVALNHVDCVFGVDKGDLLYDSEEGRSMLMDVFSDFHITFRKLLGLEGKLCKIWNHLAKYAYDTGADFFVLLGDDVRMKASGWKEGIESMFQAISNRSGHPLGVGCVAFMISLSQASQPFQ